MDQDYHRTLIDKSLVVETKLSLNLFDETYRKMGEVTVEWGNISISLNHLPNLPNDAVVAEHLRDVIGMAMEVAYIGCPEAFESNG